MRKFLFFLDKKCGKYPSIRKIVEFPDSVTEDGVKKTYEEWVKSELNTFYEEIKEDRYD